MTTVPVTRDNSNRNPESHIDPSLVEATDAAFCTGRVLDGSEDHGYAEEWWESATLPDGRSCYRVYLFDDDDIVDDHGDPLADEDYPWDDEHLARIRLHD